MGDEILENMKFISQHSESNSHKLKLFKQPVNPNYGAYYKSEQDMELREQLETLQLMSEYIKQNHGHRPKDVNYFLDDSPTGEVIQKDYVEMLKKQIILYGTCIRDTWSKGQQFFFIDAGSVVKVLSANGHYANIEYEKQYGILHLNDIKIYGQYRQ